MVPVKRGYEEDDVLGTDVQVTCNLPEDPGRTGDAGGSRSDDTGLTSEAAHGVGR